MLRGFSYAGAVPEKLSLPIERKGVILFTSRKEKEGVHPMAICISCQGHIDSPVCPHCGYPVRPQNESHQLPVGTVLRNRYQVGKVLGQGGFGITYVGRDTLLETTVAIKEFYPSGMVNRRSEQSLRVECLTEQMAGHYAQSKERFLREAKALVRFRTVPEVVDLLDFVEENDTAYIVMEYIRGVDLARYIRSAGGSLSVDETFRILRPVMEALAAVHKGDIVHRDISPDNIILDPMGGAKLLDFGAVRTVESPDAEKGLAKSTEAILKHGFAPIEQYNTRGSLGPWTDEYAMCATVWYCLTGRIPEEASIRVSEGVDPDWRSIPGLTERQCAALEKGMSVRARDRYPTMDDLIGALFGAPAPVSQPQPVPPSQLPPQQGAFAKTEAIGTSVGTARSAEPVSPSVPMRSPVEKKKRKLWPILASVAAVLVVAILIGLLSPGLLRSEDPRISAGEDLPADTGASVADPTSEEPAEAPDGTAPDVSNVEGGVKTGLTVFIDVSESISANGAEDGNIRYDIVFAAVTVDDHGVIDSCKIDGLSTNVKIDSRGDIVSDVSAPILTKNELGDNYGLVAWGGAIAEWDEQVAALCDYAVGKTVEELRDGAIDESGYALDADLAASATIYLAGYVWAIESAVRNAEYCGAQVGDELALVTLSTLDWNTATAAGGAGWATLQTDFAAVTSRDGVITSCMIDAFQARVSFDMTGTITTDLSDRIWTKYEMFDDYGMVAYGGAIAEWYEQVDSFCAYVTGKTADEVEGIAVKENTAPAEADLASSVTIAIGGFVELLLKAFR